MNIEDIIELVNREKQKPYNIKISVTKAVTCPSIEFVPSYSFVVGNEKHEKIEEKYKAEMYPEVEIALNVDGILIEGKIDLLDLKNLMIWEIKPRYDRESYIRQLSLYVTMIRKLTGLNFDGGFIYYQGDKIMMLKSVFIDTTILDTVIENIKQGKTTIAGEYCDLCQLNKKCEKKYRWKLKMGFIPVEELKLF